MRVRELNEWKTAIKIRYKYYKYKVNSPKIAHVSISFSDFVNNTFAKKFHIFVIVDWDNILIFIIKNSPIKLIEWVCYWV